MKASILSYKRRFLMLFLLFLLLTVGYGCCGIIPIHKQSKYRSVLTTALEKKGEERFPSAITSEYKIGASEKVYAFTEWFDLESGKEYVVRWEWYNPDGEITFSKDHSFKPASSYYKTWGWLSLDPKYNRPLGKWAVRVYLNNRYKDKKRFRVFGGGEKRGVAYAERLEEIIKFSEENKKESENLTLRVVEPAEAFGAGFKEIKINIYKDFAYVAKGFPWGMGTAQTPTGGPSGKPLEEIVHEPRYSSSNVLYGYFELGNSEDRRISYSVDEDEGGEWILYVDKNNNEDLTDDGQFIRNQGTGKMAAELTVTLDIITADGETIREPYNLWFFINKGPFFYARCHYAGRLNLNGKIHEVVAFENEKHDGLFRESGICIDLNDDGKCQEENERFRDGEIIEADSIRYRLSLDYP
ncbi:MAG: hypothetical protein WA162_05720 [Thermodesulfobacteriota bacterium]